MVKWSKGKGRWRSLLGLIVLGAVAVSLLGAFVGLKQLGLVASAIALGLSAGILAWAGWRVFLNLPATQRMVTIALFGIGMAGSTFLSLTQWGDSVGKWFRSLNWEQIGVVGSILGAVGQILIAILAVYVAWEQYVISRDLTIRQNTITQQQTIDAYFQGIAELMLSEEGLLEDFPMERAIAEGRTAAILGSVDGGGKAKILRFLSRSGLLTPLKRDVRVGRPILDGGGSYAEDRISGIKAIDLGVMLAGTDLSGTDLRWTDLSDINLIEANLSRCDLVRANLARTILCDALFTGADFQGVRLFYGPVEAASPRTRKDFPNYTTGAYTGAVIEGADFTGVRRMSDEQRYYCCSWGGAKTRATIPGGCEGIPDQLDRPLG